jgi:apolipoprotein N-acyltransferase
MTNYREWLFRALALISGLLLAAVNIYHNMAPLQLIALLPLFFAIKQTPKAGIVLAIGIYAGLGFVVPQMITLKLHVVVTLILLVYFIALFIVISWGCWKIFNAKLGPILGSLCVGAFFTVTDWLNFTLLPLWGTSQSLVRSWAEYSLFILFISYTGITAIIFLVSTLQAFCVNFFLYPKARLKIVFSCLLLLLSASFLNYLVYLEKPITSIKAATVGWLFDENFAGEGEKDPHTPEGFEKLYRKPVEQAALSGARLVVSGEIGFYIPDFQREEWLQRFGQVTRENNIYLIIGYSDEKLNKLLFMAPSGQVLADYTKTHLTPFECFERGSGDLKTIQIDGIKVGGMICQDDNFTDLSRKYGRKRIGLVADPTADFAAVKDAHFQGCIFRAIESRYAVVRGAANGISTIISPKGKVLLKKDHYKEGPGILVSEVPIYYTETLFSRAGHWPVGICFGFLLGVFAVTYKNS